MLQQTKNPVAGRIKINALTLGYLLFKIVSGLLQKCLLYS